MQTRDELLNGLGEAVNIIRQLANIQQRLETVRSQYRNTKPLKKFSLIGKIIIIFWIIMSFLVYKENPEIVMLVGVLCMFALPNFLFFFFRKKRKNGKIVEENKQIVANNEKLRIQEQNVLNELQQIQIVYQERLSHWYPIDYCSVQAVEFFYNAINNYRADNLKEAINLYETTMHQQRVESNQKKGS